MRPGFPVNAIRLGDELVRGRVAHLDGAAADGIHPLAADERLVLDAIAAGRQRAASGMEARATLEVVLAASAARSVALCSAATRFASFCAALRILRASAVSTRAACRSAEFASLASAVARIFSNWACFALAAVCRRSAKPGSLRDMS